MLLCVVGVQDVLSSSCLLLLVVVVCCYLLFVVIALSLIAVVCCCLRLFVFSVHLMRGLCGGNHLINTLYMERYACPIHPRFRIAQTNHARSILSRDLNKECPTEVKESSFNTSL